MRIAVAGEALIDFTSIGPMMFQGHAGGSPFNAAIAAARLGQETGFITQLSSDMFGQSLRETLQSNGVDTRFVTSDDAPSTVAFAEKVGKSVRYAFLANGSADTRYAPATLPALPEDLVFLHFGSISLLAYPTAHTITQLIGHYHPTKLIVFDPNIRPSLIADREGYKAKLQSWVSITHILKISDEDVAFLEPGVDPARAAAEWLALGVNAVIVTAGERGATLYRAGKAPLAVSSPKIDLVDAIGAGDTFTAGLSVGLLEHGVQNAHDLHATSDEAWRETLTFAAAAAAINCTRAGCNPPTRSEVREFTGR